MRNCEKDVKSVINEVEICNICGHKGFSNALMYCSECSTIAVHQYCLGIPPGIIDDTFDWFCEDCCSLIECDSSTICTMHTAIFGKPSRELQIKDKNVIFHAVVDLEPLSILPPMVVHHGNFEQKEKSNILNCREECEPSTSSFMEFPEEIMSGLILLVSPSGEIVIYKGISFCDGSQPGVLPEEYKLHATSLSDSPKDIVSRQVLLASFSRDNSTSSKNETINNKLVNGGSFVVRTSSVLDGHGSRVGKGINVRSCADINIAIDGGKEYLSDAAYVLKPMIVGYPDFNGESINCLKHERDATIVNFDLAPIGPNCKRRRSKRRKMTSTMEINGCKSPFLSAQSTCEEMNDRPSEDQNVVSVRSDIDEMNQVDTSSKTSLVVDKSHVGIISQYYGQGEEMSGRPKNNEKFATLRREIDDTYEVDIVLQATPLVVDKSHRVQDRFGPWKGG